jgi:phenylacetate-CoA ligase
VAVDTIVERQYWDEAAQTMPPDALRRLQTERLREAVERAYDGSGFFRRRFDDAGVSPADVRGLDNLARLPVFTKADLRANEAEFPPIGDYRCVGLHGSVRLATSTGTTGRPTFVLWTANDLRLDYELAARAHWRAGLRPGQVIVNAHPGYLNGGQAMNAGAHEHMGVLPISVGPPVDIEHAEQVLRVLEGVPVDHWRLFPAALARFREAAIRLGSSVELPAAEEVGPDAQHDKLSAGQECVSYLGSACAPWRGSHIAEDFAIVEVLDVHTAEPVAPGQRGTMVVTSLGRDNPMIRYDLEDIVRVDDAPCPCGETSRRGFWEGRQRDVIWIADRMVLPIDVWGALPAGAEFVLVRRPDAECLEVRVEGSVPPDAADRIAARCGVPVDVVGVELGSLPRAAYKQERVVDERAHEPSRP